MAYSVFGIAAVLLALQLSYSIWKSQRILSSDL